MVHIAFVVEFSLLGAAVVVENINIMLAAPAMTKTLRSVMALGIVIVLTVPDLNKVYKAVKKNDLTILLEPVYDYGDRVFMFLDKDGYERKISQVIRQVSLNEIKKIASGS